MNSEVSPMTVSHRGFACLSAFFFSSREYPVFTNWPTLNIDSVFQHVRFFKSEFFNFEALRLLSFAPYEGVEIAEFIQTVGDIRDNDPESWYAAWMKAGVKAEAIADDAYLANNRVEAKRAYLRAANYQRATQFMLNSPNPH